ncbi:MAG: metallophosphoesterase family protein [Gemmatimonadota bacterium]
MEIIKGPYLQWPTPTSVTVMWETDCPSRGAVTCSATEAVHSGLSGQRRAVEGSARTWETADTRRVHRVRVEGLEPGRTYHYQVQSAAAGQQVHGGPYPLQAAPLPGTPVSFAVTSETGGFGDDHTNRRLFAQLAAWRPDFLLVVGDAVGRGSRYADWERWFFGPGRQLLHTTPFYLCPGNHEEMDLPPTGPYQPERTWLHELTAAPEPGTYYGFEYGDGHFTALDSPSLVAYEDGQPRATDALAEGSPQLEFLRADLAAARAPWRFAFYHYPPYVSGDYEVPQMRRLAPLLEAGGVNVVFSSHTIVYERSHPLRAGVLDEAGGIIYVVAGGAGAKPDWFHPHRSWHTAQAAAVPHFVFVALTPGRLELRAVDIDGRVFDWLELRRPVPG